MLLQEECLDGDADLQPPGSHMDVLGLHLVWPQVNPENYRHVDSWWSVTLSPIKPFGAQASESNEVKVLRRLIQPRADGSFLVPSEIIEKFKDIKGGGREEVLRLYEKCGFNKDG